MIVIGYRLLADFNILGLISNICQKFYLKTNHIQPEIELL